MGGYACYGAFERHKVQLMSRLKRILDHSRCRMPPYSKSPSLSLHRRDLAEGIVKDPDPPGTRLCGCAAHMGTYALSAFGVWHSADSIPRC
jgi:hypothetical protein